MADPAASPNPDLPTDTKTAELISLVATLLPLTAVVVGLRLYTRRYYSNGIGADDWVSLLSLIVIIVAGVIICLMETKGLGHHIWTIPESQLTDYYRVFYQFIVFYDVGLGVVKLAILLQYLRVFSIKMRRITLGVIIVTSMWSIALVIRSIFSCVPVQGFWDKSISATCLPNYPRWYIDAAGNIAGDIIIFALPIPVLWKLQLPRSQRLSLIGIFCLGFFTCAISVIRIRFLKFSPDDTYDNAAAASWSLGELCCGLVCSSLGTLRPLAFRLLESAPLRQYCTGIAGHSSRAGAAGKYHHTSSGSRSAAPRGGGSAAVELQSRDVAACKRPESKEDDFDDAPSSGGTWLAGQSDETLNIDLERQGGRVRNATSGLEYGNGKERIDSGERGSVDRLLRDDARRHLPMVGTVTLIQSSGRPSPSSSHGRGGSPGLGIQVQRELRVAEHTAY